MRRKIGMGVLALLTLFPATTSTASTIECQQCGQFDANAERRGNQDVQASRAVSDTSVFRFTNGRFSTVRDRAGGGSGSSCPGCSYDLVPMSSMGVMGTGVPFLGCQASTGQSFSETSLLFRSRPGVTGRELLGPVCSTPGGGAAAPVVTVEMIEAELRRLVQQVAPPTTELSFAPSAGGIVNLPLLVWASPEDVLTRDFTPFGIPVSVTLAPSWEWTFERGATTRTTTPGQPYRDNGVNVADDPGYVSHTYRTPGTRTVTVTVRWSATWSLDGGAARPLGDLVRSDSAAVSVREAPSRLVAR